MRLQHDTSGAATVERVAADHLLAAGDRGGHAGFATGRRAADGSGAQRLQVVAGLAAIWLIATAYNLFKPYHIDDTAHLMIAEWITRHPLQPMSGLLNWSGTAQPIHATNQPHLYFFIMAAWALMLGWSEPAMHMLQALSTMACIALLHRLGRALAPPHALWVTAMVVLGPAFFVEQNMMVDVPLLATWLLALTPLALGGESRAQTRRFLVVAIGCSAALLVKYSSLALLPVVWGTLLLEGRWRQVWTLVIPLAVLGAWSAFNLHDYGGVHIFDRPPRDEAGPHTKDMALAFVLALGALTPLGVLAVPQARKRWAVASVWIVAGAGLGLAVLTILVASGVMSDGTSDRMLRRAFDINGLLVLAALLPDALLLLRARIWRPERARSETARLVLLLWIGSTAAFYVLLAPFMAARHILLVIPAITFLLARRWTASLDQRTKAVSIGLTMALSLALGISDWQWAAFYRSAAEHVASMPSDGQRWTSGHWGWQWYADHSGLKQIDTGSSRLASGDLVALPVEVDHSTLPGEDSLHPVAVVRESPSRYNPFCTQRPGRFYNSDRWAAPWSLSRECGDSITVFRVGEPIGPASLN